MRTFDQIFEIAADRKGGRDALEALIAPSTKAVQLELVPDARWLEQMTRCIFQAGFNWKVVEAMWPGFLEAFKGFDVNICAFMPDDWFDELVADKRIVRHGPKIRAVQQNAQFILDCREQFGSFGKMAASWPDEDYIGLLDVLKQRGTRLGGNTGQYFLRFAGKDGFILSRDVCARLVVEGVVAKSPTSKADMKAVQAAFNVWRAQSGRSLKEISRVLAMSVD